MNFANSSGIGGFFCWAAKRWDEKIGDFFRDKTSQGIGAFQAGIKAGKELFLDPMMKAAENKKILGELYEDKDQREQIKRSLMNASNQ